MYANSRLSANRAQRKRVRRAYYFTVAVVLLALCAFLMAENMRAERLARAQYETRRALSARIQYGVGQCVNLARKIIRPGAKVEKELLSQIELQFGILKALNECAADTYGAQYAPIDAQTISKITSAIAALKDRYATGRSAEQAVETLSAYICLLEDALAAGLTAEGDFKAR